MHYLDEGPRDAPVVLMVHGNPTWSFYYRNLVLALRDRYRCIVPDHIGCGLSDKPGDDRYSYTLSRRIDDLAELMTHIQAEKPVHLVVHDWGGMIGFGWAAERPEQIGKLVVGNTAAFPMPPDKKLPAALWLVRNTKIGALLVQGMNAFSGIASRVAFKKPVSAEVRKAYTGPYDSWDNRIATLRFVQCLLAWGAKDFVFDEHFLRQWKRLFPAAEIHEYADCGHYIFEDGGPALVKAVREFLDGHEYAA